MTYEEFADLVLTLRIEQNTKRNADDLRQAERAVDDALLTILADKALRSATTGQIKRRTPRPEPMPTSTEYDGGPHGWW